MKPSQIHTPYTAEEKTHVMEAVAQFKSTILRIRDILRGPGMGITGMDSMRTICIYILWRYITRKRAEELGIPEEFSWCQVMHRLHNHEDGKQEALDKLYSHYEDCLLDRIDSLFGTKDFQFKVEDLDCHEQILNLLNTVELEKVDCEIDILGWVYEQHLKTGASTSSRDLGQYFTDRFVCHYMVDLCKPILKENGDMESVCDPTMGTGGFLTSYVKYMETHYGNGDGDGEHPVNWEYHQKFVHGFDMDSRVVGVAKMNMYMEMRGHLAKHIGRRDTLYTDLPKKSEDDTHIMKYDIILANMPFGVKGIQYKRCSERIRKVGIEGRQSEPLFLQLMMKSLRKGGRCAVVVPDGMLVNTTKQHVNTRKYLIDRFALRKIVKMKGKYFMNTNIEPSIMYFERTEDGTGTENIEFWEVIRHDNGGLEETMVLKVCREELNGEYSLDLRRYQEVEEATNARGYPMVELGEVCDVKNGKTLKKNDKTEDGEYPVMGGGMSYNGKYTKYNRDADTISISKSGASSGWVHYHMCKYWAGDCFTISPKSESVLYNRYLYYTLKLSNLIQSNMSTLKTTIPHCKWGDIKKGKIPLPPLDFQQQLVTRLEKLQAQIDAFEEYQAQTEDNAKFMLESYLGNTS